MKPVAPQGVRLIHPDGTQTPLELEYDGIDSEGLHRWLVVGVTLTDAFRVHVDVLPGRTAIAFPKRP